MRQIDKLFIAFVLVILVGCKPPLVISEQNYQENSFQVASADRDYSLDMKDVYAKLYDSRLLASGGILDTAFVSYYIDSLVLDSLMGFEADTVDVSESYDKYRMFKIRYYDFLIKQFLQRMVYEKVDLDSATVVDYYYNNKEMFSIEEQVNLYHILINENNLYKSGDSAYYKGLGNEDLQIAVKNFADSVRSLITSAEIFPEIATKFSDDILANDKGGFVGWTRRNTYHPPFDSVAFSMKPGDVSDPYQDEDGWHIIMIDNYYPAGFQPLNENLYKVAYNTLKTNEVNRIGMHLIDSLLSDFDVYLNPEILNENVYVIDGQTWGAIINGIDTIDCNEARSLELNIRNKYHVDNTDSTMKAELFRQLGERYVLIQASRDVGMEQDSAVAKFRNELYHKYAKDLIATNRLDTDFEPSDSMIEAYYNDHISEFQVDKPLKVQQIIVQDSVLGEFLRDQALSGVDFLELADEYYPGEKSIRRELADLGYIGRNDVSPEFYDLAVKTEIGSVSHPVKTEFGYHVIKVFDYKKTKSLLDARSTIIPILRKQYDKEFLKNYQDKVFAKYHVQRVGTLYEVHLKPKHLRK